MLTKWQSNIIVAFFPNITSLYDIKLLELLKEIIAVKSLHRGSCLPETTPSSTASNPSTLPGTTPSSPASNSSTLPETTPSSAASNSSTVYGDYQYASSQYLRHVNFTGRPLKFSSTTPCTCLSELASVPDVSKLTSNDHASLVIRIIHCIAAHHPTGADQSVREQTLDFDSAG